jgi:DUF971 family protein
MSTHTAHNHWPVDVNLVEAEYRLVITWDDDHVSEYPLRYLRGYCPCANCQGHSGEPPKFVPTENERIADIMPVGNYAMTIVWDGGHDTGIYSFDWLRELCPCDEHKPEGIPSAQR